jgi:hypothetical protein
MKILFCNAVVLAVAAIFAFVAGSILWDKLAGIPASFDVTEPEDDLEPPEAQGPDDDAWDRGHDEYVDRQVGL